MLPKWLVFKIITNDRFRMEKIFQNLGNFREEQRLKQFLELAFQQIWQNGSASYPVSFYNKLITFLKKMKKEDFLYLCAWKTVREVRNRNFPFQTKTSYYPP